jgi:methylthioribulose-1-phosphate dehydratase
MAAQQMEKQIWLLKMLTEIEPEIETLKTEMVQAIRFFHQQGWAPATSSNYSFRLPGRSDFFISQSGVDKGAFQTEHFMPVDAKGKAIKDPRKPSAETLLHCAIYDLLPDVHCILHTHTVFNTVLSQKLDTHLTLAGYEILKGFAGIGTHEIAVKIPVFQNSQDMPALSQEIVDYFKQAAATPHAFLLAGHGMYTWGNSIADAKRHVEVMEFLIHCEVLKRTMG